MESIEDVVCGLASILGELVKIEEDGVFLSPSIEGWGNLVIAPPLANAVDLGEANARLKAGYTFALNCLHKIKEEKKKECPDQELLKKLGTGHRIGLSQVGRTLAWYEVKNNGTDNGKKYIGTDWHVYCLPNK